jgi:hypothetical protein
MNDNMNELKLVNIKTKQVNLLLFYDFMWEATKNIRLSENESVQIIINWIRIGKWFKTKNVYSNSCI